MVAISSLTTALTYVIGLCGIVPLFPWLTPLPRLLLAAGMVSGLWLDRRGSWRLKPWVQNIAIVPVFLYYALQFSRSNPIQPVVSVLAIMLAVRFCGEKTVRHSLQIHVLSMFCLASSSLFDLSPLFLIYLGVMLFSVALALVLLTFQNQDSTMTVSMPDLKRILLSALLMPSLALPLLLIFFPILPRTQMPLWHILTPPATRTTGYADSVEPGSQSSIAESRSLAFRAEAPRLATSQLYWRATVFNRTDGLKWTRSDRIPGEQIEPSSRTVAQVIFPEPSASRALVALDRPASLALQRVKRSPDGVFERVGAAGGRLSYSAESVPTGVVAQRGPVNRPFYLQLPELLPARITALAAEVSRSGVDDRGKVTFLEKYFRGGGYRYSTRELPTGDRAVEEFLFDKKLGHCEFFASSFALLLRAAGVPCRLVGGYLGGEYNQLGEYYLVTDDKAHVWVEAYIEGSGWTRIDPSSFAANAGVVWAPPPGLTLRRRLGMAVDTFNHAWNRSVIPYDFEQQFRVVTLVGSRLQGVNIAGTARRAMPLLAGCLLIAGLLVMARRSLFFRTREERILRRFLRTVEGMSGIPAVSGRAGLFEIAAASENSHVSDFVSIYAGAVYHDRKLRDDEYLRLRQLLAELQRGETKKT